MYARVGPHRAHALQETSRQLQARVAATTTLRLDCEAARDAHALEGDAIDAALTKAGEEGVFTPQLRKRVDEHVASGKRLCERMREYGQLATALAVELNANAAAYGECGTRATAWAEKVGSAQGRRGRAIVAREILFEVLAVQREQHHDAILLAVLHRSCTPRLESAAVPLRRSKRSTRTGPYVQLTAMTLMRQVCGGARGSSGAMIRIAWLCTSRLRVYAFLLDVTDDPRRTDGREMGRGRRARGSRGDLGDDDRLGPPARVDARVARQPADVTDELVQLGAQPIVGRAREVVRRPRGIGFERVELFAIAGSARQALDELLHQ